MYFCGRYSISEAVLSIVVGDVLFSTGSLLVHTAESIILSGSVTPTPSIEADVNNNIIFKYDHVGQTGSNLPNHSHNATLVSPEQLILPSEMSEDVKRSARTILCWAYMGLHLVNMLMAGVLWQAVIKESVLKCICYLVISPALIGLGFCFVLYHFLILGLSPFYYAVAIYPAYWLWKAGSLLVVSKFLQQIRDTGIKKKRREEYYQLAGGSSTSSLINTGWGVQGETQNEQFETEDELPLLPRKFDILEDRLKLDHQICLGFDDHNSIIRGLFASSKEGVESGEFVDVAVKTLKVTTPTIPYSGRLLKEAHLLAYIGEHESILKFLGVCCKSNPKEKLFLVMEYYPKGRLDTFLKDCMNTYDGKTFKNLLDADDRICVSSTRKGNDLPKFDTLNMLEWAYQISNGMEYLHQKRIIHGCLQAKSIILIGADTVKIWDFSFAMKLKRANYTVKREDLPNRFPWRWSALECLTTPSDPSLSDLIPFSTRTDVWGFAVLLWEIFTVGEVPYGGWDSDIVRGLVNGMRLEKPEKSSQQIYEIMNACWRPDPLDRPNFALLKLFFQQLLSSLKATASKLSIY